ncbi:PBS lyase HEAT domain protein repeat-containing protein [Stanieria cyanosphaera PCC 7437]|uniref:PBS lyase HEAT domain protein repeat-containing protein n=1 Tax=Stanieria cyanosphaera (strain ATCC 29371 / PCC 7437) TaxID=111780 RepID=K9XX52_STAC7|nr:HEAT repeat domain-containing protein [Stanieria cyanosphaera]AFZ36634.1 PBS lyase HEAT domain protein repeat-containing protein [Stanieria cyanosphaera PCC 7437]
MSNNQNLSIEQLFHNAYLAAEAKNWLQVNYYLQQLLLRQNRGVCLEKQLEDQFIALALNVLFYGDFQLRWEVNKIFVVIGTSVIKPLIKVLEDENVDLEIRWFTCRILAEFNSPEVIFALIKLLQNSEEELALMATEALAQIGVTAIESLTNLLNHPEYRLLVVTALAQIRHPETIPALLQVVKDQQPAIRAIAIEALGSFHDQRIPPVLIEALQDLNATVRKEAVISLGFRADLCQELNLVEIISPLLYDFNLEVCRQTASTLARMKSDQAIQALNQVLISEVTPTNLKLDLLKALSWSKTKLALVYLEQALFRENQSIQVEIINLLGRITKPSLKPQAVKILLHFWQNNSKETMSNQLKQKLATSLGELKNDQAFVMLNELAADPEQIVKLHAIAALKKIA